MHFLFFIFSKAAKPRAGVARLAIVAVVCGLMMFAWPNRADAQPPIHYPHSVDLSPGAVGAGQLLRGGPLPGYFQPVEIRGPQGSAISLQVNGRYEPSTSNAVMAGMLIGQVYRMKVTGIPRREGFEVYPTVEVINRLYPPKGLKDHFPIPIELSQEELELALSGRFVTRVIYLEDPNQALPVATKRDEQLFYEVKPEEDPLLIADRLGRPMAILRMGSRVPTGPNESGLEYGTPPLVRIQKPAPLPDRKAGLEPPLPPPGPAKPAGAQARNVPRIPLLPPPQFRAAAQPVIWMR